MFLFDKYLMIKIIKLYISTQIESTEDINGGISLA